jgi:Flp pilus assembly protein TadB
MANLAVLRHDRHMVHTVLLAVSLGVSAVAFAAYMWDTRDERREFARRVERAQRIREAACGGRIPRGRIRG